MTAVGFIVPGNAVPWSLVRAAGTFTRTPGKVKAYKALVRAHAMRAVGLAKRSGMTWPLDAKYRVSLVVHRKDWQRCDVDRLVNAILDGMTGVVYEDDRHAFVRAVEVVVGEPDAKRPRVVVGVRVVEQRELDAWADLNARYAVGDAAARGAA